MKHSIRHELSTFFEPYRKSSSDLIERKGTIAKSIFNLHDSLQQDIQFDVVLLGVSDYRLSKAGFYEKSADIIREELYALSLPMRNIHILDLGNLKLGQSTEDTTHAVSYVMGLLKAAGVVSLVLGANRFLLHALAQNYTDKGVSYVSRELFIDDDYSFPCDENAISYTLTKSSFSESVFQHIGSQRYFVTADDVVFEKKNKIHRIGLGKARKNIEEVEPLLRTTTASFFDISSIKGAFALGQENPSPNGFYPEELCQMAYYAGINDGLTCFAVTSYSDLKDSDGLTAKLVAQLYWHLIDGIAHRVGDYPVANLELYKKMLVAIDENQKPFVFYKSNLTDRWWVEGRKFEKTFELLPCTYADYLRASEGEIPEVWLRYLAV